MEHTKTTTGGDRTRVACFVTKSGWNYHFRYLPQWSGVTVMGMSPNDPTGKGDSYRFFSNIAEAIAFRDSLLTQGAHRSRDLEAFYNN